MHLAGSDLIVSATDLSGFLACPHLTAQDLSASRGGPKPPKFDDPGAEVLRQRGHEHEARILEGYRARELDVVALARPDWDETGDGTWRRYAAETLEEMRRGADVIHQACLFDGRFLGLPDFLVKVERPSELGDWSYEVVDAKLARSAKVGAVLQICVYSEMLERTQGRTPERMHLALGGGPAEDAAPVSADGAGDVAANGGGSGPPNGPADGPANGANHGIESFRYADFAAYYRSVKARFGGALETEPETYPEPCAHCTVCAWPRSAKGGWEADDHLFLQDRIGVSSGKLDLGWALPTEAGSRRLRLQPLDDHLPEPSALALAQVVRPTPLDIRLPARWVGDPQLLRPEEGLHQQDTADDRIDPRLPLVSPQSRDPPPDVFVCRRAVLDSEGLPRHGQRKLRVVLEEPAAGDVVVRPLQLEEQRLAVAEDSERSAPRLRIPEVDLVHILLVTKKMKPVRIGRCHVGVHPSDPSSNLALPRTASTRNRSSFSSIFRAMALPMSIPSTSASLSR